MDYFSKKDWQNIEIAKEYPVFKRLSKGFETFEVSFCFHFKFFFSLIDWKMMMMF